MMSDKGKAIRITIQPWFSCFKRSIGDPVLFLIDTGSTITFLSELDAKRLSLDYSSLKKLPENEWVGGIGGKLPLYRIMEECKLTFQTAVATEEKADSKFNVQTLEHCDVVKVEVADENIRQQILANIPSILGMDVIRNFKFVATNDAAYLEC